MIDINQVRANVDAWNKLDKWEMFFKEHENCIVGIENRIIDASKYGKTSINITSTFCTYDDSYKKKLIEYFKRQGFEITIELFGKELRNPDAQLYPYEYYVISISWRSNSTI